MTNFEGGILFCDDETAYRLGADLYIDLTFSVGLLLLTQLLMNLILFLVFVLQKFFTPAIS